MSMKQHIRARVDFINREIQGLLSLNAHFEIEDCPLYGPNGHNYEESQLLNGLLCMSWECPFCGFKVE